MASTILAAAGLFAATNIEGIVILAAFFLASTRGSIRGWQIVLGQYVGFGALVALSVAAATGLSVIPDEWVGLLGLVPLVIGIFGLGVLT